MDSFPHNKNRLLLSALKKGNIESFENLYKNYKPRIFTFSLRYLKVIEDAEELTQEVFIELWKNRKKIDINLSLSSFLFTIAKNKIIDHFRKQKRENLYNNYLQHYIDFSIDNTANNFVDKQMVNAIKKLPEKRKIVFLLSKKFGLSRKEIADFLEVSENTVKNQLQEAIKYLRHILSRETVVSILLFINYFLSH